jgi:RNA recognition motif-containing protein
MIPLGAAPPPRQEMTHRFRRSLDLIASGPRANTSRPRTAKPSLLLRPGSRRLRTFLTVPGHSGPAPRSGPPAQQGDTVGKKLYVGNLSFDVTDDQLREMFAPYGAVQSAQVISDRDTGRSKGFGFVEMGSEQEAQAAIDGMSGQMVGGRSLTVNEAKPKENRPGGGGGGGRGGYGGGNRGNRY